MPAGTVSLALAGSQDGRGLGGGIDSAPGDLRSTLYGTKVSLKLGCLSKSHQGMVVEVPGLPVLLACPAVCTCGV